MQGLTWGRRQACDQESQLFSLNLSSRDSATKLVRLPKFTRDCSRAEVISDKLRTVFDLTSLIVRVTSMGKIYNRFEHMDTKKES